MKSSRKRLKCNDNWEDQTEENKYNNLFFEVQNQNKQINQHKPIKQTKRNIKQKINNVVSVF